MTNALTVITADLTIHWSQQRRRDDAGIGCWDQKTDDPSTRSVGMADICVTLTHGQHQSRLSGSFVRIVDLAPSKMPRHV
jgi:hypothetical protein